MVCATAILSTSCSKPPLPSPNSQKNEPIKSNTAKVNAPLTLNYSQRPLNINISFEDIEIIPSGAKVQYLITFNVLDFFNAPDPLKNQTWKVSSQFINFYQSKKNNFHEKHPLQSSEFHSANYIKAVHTSVISAVAQEGRLLIHLRIESKSNPGLSFSGVFDLGRSNSIQKSISPKLVLETINLKQTPYVSTRENLLLSMSSLSNDVSNGSYTRPLNQYVFNNISFKYKGLDRSLERTHSRTVRIGITACIKDPLFLKPVTLRKLNIDTYKKIEQPDDYFSNNYKNLLLKSFTTKPTDLANGCFGFSDSISFDWYDKERVYIKPYTVTDKTTGTQSVIAAVVDPWNTGWIFAQDIRKVEKSEIYDIPEHFPETLIKSINMDAVGVRYFVDNQLKLHLIKKYNVLISPLITRFDSLSSGSFGSSPIKGGFYLLNIALAKKTDQSIIKQNDFINAWQTVVAVKNGSILTQIELSVDDLRLMGTRNRLIVQIKPINEDQIIFMPKQAHLSKINREIHQVKTMAQTSLLKRDSSLISNTFQGPFIPLNLHQSPSLIQTKMDAHKYIYKSRKWLDKKSAQINNFAPHLFDKHFRLKSIDLTKDKDKKWLLSSPRIIDNDLQYLLPSLISTPNYEPELELKLQYKLCHLWADRLIPEQIKKFQLRLSKEDDSNVKPLSKPQIQRASRAFKRNCINFTRKHLPFFQLDKKIFVKSIDPKAQNYMGGVSFNYGIGSSFHLNKSRYFDSSNSESNSLSFTAGVSDDVIPFVDLKMSLAQQKTASSSNGYGMGHSSSLSYNFGAYLVIQNSTIRLKINTYKNCLIVTPKLTAIRALLNTSIDELINLKQLINNPRLDPTMNELELTPELREQKIRKKLRYFVSNQHQLDLFESGLRICSELTHNKPIEIAESYYYVTQHFLAGDMHDPASLKNRPWLMSIRSNRDFKVFIQAVQNHNKLTQVGDLNHLPVQTLMEAYTEYNSALPSWPGVITLEKVMPLQQKKCETQKSFQSYLYDTLTSFFKGPFQWKNNSSAGLGGINFWETYFCPHKNDY